MTRLLLCRLWQFVQLLGRPLAYRGRHSAICPICHIRQIFADFYTTRPGRHSAICQRSPKHCANCQTRQWIRGRVVAKSAGSGELVFSDCGNLRHLDRGLPRTVAQIATVKSLNLRAGCHRPDLIACIPGNLRAELGNPQSTCERFAKKLFLL
jgi:hypothetical protein